MFTEAEQMIGRATRTQGICHGHIVSLDPAGGFADQNIMKVL